MKEAILTLDSGTTVTKAAAFTIEGELIATASTDNTALRRVGDFVEQDLLDTSDSAFFVLAEVVRRIEGRKPGVLVITGQGDGVWPVDCDGEPLGKALTWLDARSASLLADLRRAGIDEAVREMTLSIPTTASASVQLLWMAKNDPERFARIHYALRCKEWLFYRLTGQVLTEPAAVMPTWGNWRRQEVGNEVFQIMGLSSARALLPEIVPLQQSARPLSAEAARALNLSGGLQVMMGPSDTQATAIGLGLGIQPDLSRASVIGTSAIHVRHLTSLDEVRPEPLGGMLTPFVEAGQYFRSSPSLNGSSVLAHLRSFTQIPEVVSFKPSGLVFHPFIEPAGERSPITDQNAQAAIFGLTPGTHPAEIASAAMESLCFLAKASHRLLGLGSGFIGLGGGLSNNSDFTSLFATIVSRPVARLPSLNPGLTGLGMLGARQITGRRLSDLATTWLPAELAIVQPRTGPVADYLGQKERIFFDLIDKVSPSWDALSEIAASARSAVHHSD
jgi:xylulokinase/erythritol kinase